METVTPVANGAQMPQTPEDEKLKELYQEYLQKCCEVGQIRYNIEQLDSQKAQLEKQLETTERAVKTAANKHKDLQAEKFSKLKPKTEDAPALELGKQH